MATRRVPFHNKFSVVVQLPQLLLADGTPCSLAGRTAIELYCSRDNTITTEKTVVGVSPLAGQTPGALNVTDNAGYLNLTTDTAYWSDGIPATGVVNVDGMDFPQDGWLLLDPLAVKE
jgi:hypothetical protein